ncbi:MAG: hypothetical protein SGILL_006241 [Bacillariaceae sp.]
MIMKTTSFLSFASILAVMISTGLLSYSPVVDAQVGCDDGMDIVTSSPFKMVLYPTPEPLDATATNKVQHAIKTALLLSSSITTNFISVDDVDVQLNNVDFEEAFEPLNPLSNIFATTTASVLDFRVQMCFLDLAEQATLPSRFALDNLIVRTFSQPSSKASFVVTLGLARDPILNEVLDIEIDIVDETSSPVDVDDGRKLSTVDIVLIAVSVSIFFGIIAVLCYYNKTQPTPEDVRPSATSRETKSSVAVENSSEVHIDTSHSKESETNETPGNSPKTFDSVHSVGERSSLEDIDTMPFEDNIVEGSSLESSIDNQSGLGFPAAESLDGSIASSGSKKSESPSITSSSSSKKSSSSESSSSEDSSSSSSDSSSSSSSGSDDEPEPSAPDMDAEKDAAPTSSQLLGATQPDYCGGSVSSSSTTSQLTKRLISLSSINAFDLSNRFNPFSSSSSAPPALDDNGKEQTISGEAKMEEKSVSSAYSASDESWDSGQQITSYSMPTYRREKKGHFGGTFVLESFQNNWVESKKRALEDIEEGSVEDVFQIGKEAPAIAEETESRVSVRSVSDWMRSIRVVGSASETQSSMEHSSVEPKSYIKDNSSIDLSLEQSLATSTVDSVAESKMEV